MLEHVVHGPGEVFTITHTGAVLTIEVSRSEAGFAAHTAMGFRHETDAFLVGPAVQRADGLLWTPIDRGRARLWIRHGYRAGDSRVYVWIDAPRSWAVRWDVPRDPFERRASPAGATT